MGIKVRNAIFCCSRCRNPESLANAGFLLQQSHVERYVASLLAV